MEEELGSEQSLEILRGMSFGRLACARGGQPYIVPINFAVDDHYLYGFSMMGKKIAWMRANPLVCVEADQVISSHQWTSIVVSGKYEELPDTPEWQGVRTSALRFLPVKNKWWEPWSTTVLQRGAHRPLTPLFYRIHIVEISGRRAIPDSHTRTRDRVEPGVLQKILKSFRPEPTTQDR